MAKPLIPVPFPHMCLNSHNVPPPDYQMMNTWKVAASESPGKIVGWIAQVAAGAPGGKLATVIFNSHGIPSGILMGSGIRRPDTGLFSALRGLVDRIWIVACRVALIQNATGPGSTAPGDGNLFCCELAKASGAYVTASTTWQRVDRNDIPPGYIDGWEGAALTYGPEGNVVGATYSPL